MMAKEDKTPVPCGTEPFDKCYGIGYQSGHADYSPFARVNRLRRTFLERPFTIDAQRAVLVTQASQAHEGEPEPLRQAYMLANVLRHVDIALYDEEPIVGEIAAPAKAAPIYPEFSVDWILDELKNHPFDKRPNDSFAISDAVKQTLLAILPYWQGRTIADRASADLSATQRLGSQLGRKVFMTNLYHYGGVGHYVMDYAKLLRVGFGGLRKEIEQRLARLTDDAAEERTFLLAAHITLTAATEYILRYAALAERSAFREANPDRRRELVTIAANCHQVASGPATTYWQALQLWHFATTIALIESNGHSVSYGRMDQWLYPYYEADIRAGRLTKTQALELLECAYVKMGNPSKLKDRQTVSVRNGRGWGGESLTIGGVDAAGNDATNDLTYLMLEASVHTRMMNPWVCVRVHPGTPRELKLKIMSCIRAGYGHPKLYNDVTAIKIMRRKGMTLAEARDYAVVGCVEPDLPGREFGWHDAAYMNLARVLELSINGGKCIDCKASCPFYADCVGAGRTLGPDTGSLETAADFAAVQDSFHAQLDFWVGQMCAMLCALDETHRALKPTPFASVFFDDCIKTGRDLTAGGARYNFTGPQASGIATCADALSTIKQMQFEDKSVTGAELLDAVRRNWEGYDVLYHRVNGKFVPHFGNDDDRADALYVDVFNSYCDAVAGRANPRGGTFCPGVYTVNANVGMGLDLAASLDGRKAGEPISDNMGPVHTIVASHDVSGPTAIANSVNKADHSRATNGTLLNWKFPQGCVTGARGLANLIDFTDAYFDGGALHCQFNIMSSETMRRAMRHPEQYRDMLVRVAGYSAYFVELSKPLQMDLISRTELSFG